MNRRPLVPQTSKPWPNISLDQFAKRYNSTFCNQVVIARLYLNWRKIKSSVLTLLLIGESSQESELLVPIVAETSTSPSDIRLFVGISALLFIVTPVTTSMRRGGNEKSVDVAQVDLLVVGLVSFRYPTN